MPLDPKEIGQRIKGLRESSGLSQKEFSKKILSTQASVSYYEKGVKVPDPQFLLNISESFNCSVDWILTGEERGVIKDYEKLNDKHKSLIRESISSYLKAQKK